MNRTAPFLIAAAGAVLGTGPAAAQDPQAVVRAYAEAANRGDLDGFVGLYAPDVRKFRFPGTLTSEGREHARAVYAKSFAEKSGIKVEILDVMVLGDKVVARDRVTGLPDGKTAEEITVYQVKDGLITNVVYVERLTH